MVHWRNLIHVEPSCSPSLIELTPNEWKSINIDVVDRAKYAGFFCQVYPRDSSPIIDGSILDKAYVGGLIQIDGNMYFPYKVPSNNGFEDEYLNASEYGFIGREGNKVVLEYVYGKYTNTNGITQNLKGNASTPLKVMPLTWYLQTVSHHCQRVYAVTIQCLRQLP